ncbi:MAG: hypothetical protein C0594_01305 [Marinilabiliales bacterium]|nr:MAG: hypothetical protein C0594_01305 [Marinilabiliales bacterium]
MRRSLKYKILLRKDWIRADGTALLYIRLTSGSKVKYINLNYAIDPKKWDFQKNYPKTGLKNYELICNYIDKTQIKVDKAILNLNIKDKALTFSNFENEFFGNSKDSCFYEFAEQEIQLMKGKIQNCTIRNYNCELTKLKKFRPDILISEIDTDFLSKYESYMRNELDNKTNTVWGSFKRIKKLLNIAKAKGILESNPFDNYKVKKQTTNKQFLTIQELKKVEGLMEKDIPFKFKEVIRYFLFSCYTGLRYQDVLNLKYSDISEDTISIIVHKTKEPLLIPLTNHAKKFIKDGKGLVFDVLTNQKTNEYLKVIMFYAEIDKKISFHCARHTFATISLTIGIPIEVISKILGHSDLKTTQVYAKIVDDLKKSEMSKWDSI